MLQLASSLQHPTRSQGIRDTTQLANTRRNTQAKSIIDTNKRWLSNPDEGWLNSSNITQLQYLDPPLSTLLWRTHRWPLFTILTSATFAPTDTKKIFWRSIFDKEETFALVRRENEKSIELILFSWQRQLHRVCTQCPVYFNYLEF